MSKKHLLRLPGPFGEIANTCAVTAYADGSSLGNPGPGGWAVLIVDPDGRMRAPLSGGEPTTTNNRMELLAAINAYEAIGPDTPAGMFLDSEYVVTGLNTWVDAWVKRGWRTSGGKPVANRDLWEHLRGLHLGSMVKPGWVRAHAGHPLNEAVDRLARAAANHTADQFGWVP